MHFQLKVMDSFNGEKSTLFQKETLLFLFWETLEN